MLPFSWPMLIYFSLVLSVLGAVLGLGAGFVINHFSLPRAPLIFGDLVLGVVAAFAATFISGWAGEEVANPGQGFLVWDSTWTIKPWRTTLADGELLLAVLIVTGLVASWHIVYRFNSAGNRGASGSRG